jgi:hypothetical protein
VEENWLSILVNRVSKVASFKAEAVSDIFDTDASSSLWPWKFEANDTECAGVEEVVVGVPVDVVSFFFFKALRTLLRKVDIESVSL